MSGLPSRSWFAFGAALLLIASPGAARAQSGYADLKAEGARLYSEQSFALAYQAWKKAFTLDVPEADRRTLSFYLADSLWRSRPGVEGVNESRKALRALADTKPRDAIGAEALESLGDSWLADTNGANWPAAWKNYQEALAFWAASSDLDTARERYLGIVWKATGPPSGSFGGANVPVEILARALEIATTTEDTARAHFFLGAAYAQRGDAFSQRRAGQEWERVVDAGNETAVYEAALFRLAHWNLSFGTSEWRPDGGLVLTPDFQRALRLFRRFVKEFPAGQSEFTAAAVSQIKQITAPALDLAVGSTYLPGSEPAVAANWRNIPEINFVLRRVNLREAFQPTARTDPSEWLDAVRVSDADVVKRWTESDPGSETRAPRNREIELDAISEPGMYLIEASGRGRTARELIVVSEGAVILNTTGPKAAALFCNARTGTAVPESSAKLWRSAWRDGSWQWESVEGRAAGDGLVRLDVPVVRDGSDGDVFLFGLAGTQPVLARSHSFIRANGQDSWRIQVFTARAAYRPGDAVEWKLIARTESAGGLETPAGRTLKFEITDPNGAVVEKGEVKLTEFGGAWGKFATGGQMPLGEYTMQFQEGTNSAGADTLFRLEEYKLPEFKVSVSVPKDADGRVRLGDTLVAKVAAEYYFGGGVPGAEINVRVTESPWARPIPFPRAESMQWNPGGGRTVIDQKLRSSPDGFVTVEIPTPVNAQSDLSYAIEARAVDASGREVIGTASVVVGRQSYFVDLTPSRRVALPGDKLTIAVVAKDGNDTPAAAKGTVTVTRERWTETWIDPRSNEITGETLDRLRHGIFPPPAEFGWRLKSSKYTSEEIARFEASTNAQGTGTFSFDVVKEGFYRIAWQSPDRDGPPVTAATNVWVNGNGAQMIGYHASGIEVIVDPTAPADGGRITAMIVTDTSNRDVLFTVDAGSTLLRAEALHIEGDAKLVELTPDAAYVPNVFLTASTVRGLQFFSNTAEVNVPPVRHTLKVELTPGKERHLPGEEAEIGIKVTDFAGKPTAAEVALSVSDEAISYIQADYAGDPVEFFFGQKRNQDGMTSSSLTWRPCVLETRATRAAARLEAALAARGAVGRSWGRDKSSERMLEKDAAFAMDGAAPAAAPMMRAMVAESSAAAEPADSPAVRVRSDFRATALWEPAILTGRDGTATAKLRYPDSLTTWNAVARVAGTGPDFGFGKATTQTTKPLIARLQAPRFLVAGDSATVAGIFNNRTDGPLDVKADLRVEGLTGSLGAKNFTITPDGDARVEWAVGADATGAARLTLTGVSGALNDGMELTLPVVENGIDKSVSLAGKASASETALELVIPAERRKGSESLVLTATPSLAAAALDALPYLIKYPYGCVEQTMSRFLPAVATARTLQNLGLDPAAIADRVFGGIEREFLPQTHPADPARRGLADLDAVVQAGLARLTDFQHGDGAWGWWKEDASDPFMTAYVVWGLRVAQQSGVGIRNDVLDRGAGWLRAQLVQAVNEPNLQAWMLHALAALHSEGAAISGEEKAAIENLWTRRDAMTAYGRALLAISVHRYGDDERAQILARNLHDGAVIDRAPGVSAATGAGSSAPGAIATAHWGSDGVFRLWQDGGVEATAFALQALVEIDPSSELVEPAMNWLVKNRRGAQWSNTRDTTITLLALNTYLKTTKELGREVSFEALVNGKVAGEVKNATALAGQSVFRVDPALLKDGANQIVLRRTGGDAPIYYSARAEFFTREDPIEPAGNEIFAKREYSRTSGRPTLLDGYQYDSIPWTNGESAPTNERVEVVLTIEAKNDLEYLVFEDLKPAGLEAVSVKSGAFLTAIGANGAHTPVFCELRDRKVALFIRSLKQGVWTIRYNLRTETPGDFSALPVIGHAMYVPEIRCNGASSRVKIHAPQR